MTSPRLLVRAVARHPVFLLREQFQYVGGDSWYEYPNNTRFFLPLPVGMYAAVIPKAIGQTLKIILIVQH